MSWRINDGNWRSRAACSSENREQFFPEGRPSSEPIQMCASCPVRQECLETALSAPWRPYGIWGGLTTADLWPMWSARHPRHRHNETLAHLGLAG